MIALPYLRHFSTEVFIKNICYAYLMTEKFLSILMFGALAAVVGVLVFGLIIFFKGGEFSTKQSNEAMRWRILLQALALAIFFLILWVGR